MRGKCAVIDSLCIQDDPSHQLRTNERLLTSRSMDLDVERRRSMDLDMCQTATRECAESPDPSRSLTLAMSQASAGRRSAAEQWAECTALLVAEQQVTLSPAI